MKLTSSLFGAYLKCPTKCFLWSRGETGIEDVYGHWSRTQDEFYRREAGRHMRMECPGNELLINPIGVESLKTSNWRWALDFNAETKQGSFSVQALRRDASRAEEIPAEIIPVHFVFRNKLTRHDEMLLTFDGLLMSEVLGCEVRHGEIVNGNQFKIRQVKTSARAREVRDLTEKMIVSLKMDSPPDLVLNRHCAECEFQLRCRQQAIQCDDLSLLSAITEKERTRLRGKGIFTVTQLSYTFRPRKARKRAKNPANPHYYALQALSIRENTIHIHGNPQIHTPEARVYLDVEGLADNAFYYLIGALVVVDGQETFHSLWANEKSEEARIFTQCVETISLLRDFQVFHFGNYENTALKRVKESLPDYAKVKMDTILKRSVNVLSAVHSHIYFPTYSNSLKDIGRFLGVSRTHQNASGLDAIVWRMNWNSSHSAEIKASLVQYNKDDCVTLKCVSEFIDTVVSADATTNPFRTIWTEEIPRQRSHWKTFSSRQSGLEDFNLVIKCAYFDYQREKVLVRTHRHFRSINRQHRKLRHTNVCPNQLVNLESHRCHQCNSKKLEQIKQLGRLLIDLKFSKYGMRKFVTRFLCWQYKCQKCGCEFSSRDQMPDLQAYGHGLVSWCIYLNVACGVNMSRVRKSLGDAFGIFTGGSQIDRFKQSAAEYYAPLYEEILIKVLQESALHVDETTVNLRGESGYVWVLTTMDKVYYFYRPSREGSFLKEMLAPFKGVLISDFYAAYDTLSCTQQKCIVHFVRDIDDDLLRNPLDTELKCIAQEFGTLLRMIIKTVDSYGLKSRHLRKHKLAVCRFLDLIGSRDYSSELANGYKKRFTKSGAKMFTFLDFDGVPWNNNNAEHAIKRFAKYRRDVDGRFTERTLKEYLVLASVFETCEFNNVNVLKFLISEERTLDGLNGQHIQNRASGDVRSRRFHRWNAL
jgi:predicted RecB family nuclease